MWSISEIKKRGRHNIRKNYWRAIFTGLLILVIAGGYRYNYSLLNVLGASDTSANAIDSLSDSGVTNQLLSYINRITELFPLSDFTYWGIIQQFDPFRALLSSLFHTVTDSNSLIITAFNLSEKGVSGGNAELILLSLAGSLVFIGVQVFVRNVLIVGEKRFYIENSKYNKTDIQSIMMPYIVKGGVRCGFSYFVKSLYQFLWNLTIFGGLVKHYSYLMVPYILAENPLLGPHEAINLSRKMMKGHKWQAFKMELTFLFLKLVNIFTLGLLSVFWLNPYMSATFAELYMELRDNDSDDFIDKELGDSKWLRNYRLEDYPLELHSNHPIHLDDYNLNYSFLNILIMFSVFVMIGWLWEVNFTLMDEGIFVNRGTLHGPWVPLYGTGGMLVLLLLKRYSSNILKTYLFTVILVGSIEYLTGTLLWYVRGMKWWDYTGYAFNLHGRICLEGLLVFGIMGIMVIYILAPFLNGLIEKLSRKQKIIIIIVFYSLFIADGIYSQFNPNTGIGITMLKFLE